jgi:hypothetical protein
MKMNGSHALLHGLRTAAFISPFEMLFYIMHHVVYGSSIDAAEALGRAGPEI